jgi:hypothetical protein
VAPKRERRPGPATSDYSDAADYSGDVDEDRGAGPDAAADQGLLA